MLVIRPKHPSQWVQIAVTTRLPGKVGLENIVLPWTVLRLTSSPQPGFLQQAAIVTVSYQNKISQE